MQMSKLRVVQRLARHVHVLRDLSVGAQTNFVCDLWRDTLNEPTEPSFWRKHGGTQC